MLSLPLIPPQVDGQALHFNAPFRPLVEAPSASNNQNAAQQNTPHNQQQLRQLQQRRDEERKAHNARSPLALLAADEAAIAQRKLAIRNFGAYWIRPPGVSKTLQAMTEELAELAEQEELLRQEQGLRDMQAQQELEEARQRAAQAAAAAQEDDEAGEGERDLDEDIPEADEEVAEDLSFNEDSMMDGASQEGDLEEAELTGAARDEEELGVEHEDEMQVERDLDDSVPEAGSYQHTDSEAEDSLSDSELQDSFAEQSAAAAAAAAAAPASGSSDPRPQAANSSIFGTPNQGSEAPEASSGLPPRVANRPLTRPLFGREALESYAADFERQRERERERGLAPDPQGHAALQRSPGNWNLSSSVLGSSFIGSSPAAQRGAMPRGTPRR